MAELSFHVESVAELDKTSLVRVSGAIDAKTVLNFQERLEQLQKDGNNRFILDMDGIKYVNSTGLGTLVNVADNLENAGGGIALVCIHPKVKVVFDMLGLNAFFKIYATKEEAIGAIHEQLGGSAPADEPVEEEEEEEVPPPPPPKEPVAARVHKPQETTFQVVCQNCNVNLTIRKPGSYKCPRCSTFFKLDGDGQVQFYKRKKAAPLQMKLACTDECREGLSEFITVLARRIGFEKEQIKNIRAAIDDACNTIIQDAYENKQHLSYNVVIMPSSSELKIQLADYGKFLASGNGSVFGVAREKMDQFEHKQHPKGGNVISMLIKI